MGGFISDMDQDHKIMILEKRVRRLENKLNGGFSVTTGFRITS